MGGGQKNENSGRKGGSSTYRLHGKTMEPRGRDGSPAANGVHKKVSGTRRRSEVLVYITNMRQGAGLASYEDVGRELKKSGGEGWLVKRDRGRRKKDVQQISWGAGWGTDNYDFRRGTGQQAGPLEGEEGRTGCRHAIWRGGGWEEGGGGGGRSGRKLAPHSRLP